MKAKATPVLQVSLDFGGGEQKVGRMAAKDGLVWFEYDPAFKNTGLEISPIRLPLSSGVVSAKYQPFEGLWGVFNDSLPDGWGRLLLDRALTARGVDAYGIGAMERLAHVGHRGMGALIYRPEAPFFKDEEGTLDLDELAQESELILEGEASDLLVELLLLGGSSQGARPKVLAGFNPATGHLIHGTQALPEGYEHWLIKFTSAMDRPDAAQMEFAYAQMARHAGIEVPEVRLFHSRVQKGKPNAYFGTRRFDRAGGKRLHMHTASGMLQADHRIPSLDYETLMQCAMHLQTDHSEAERMFRMAAFNVLAHNQDDHGKNFTFLMDESGDWRLSPAYDLTFSHGPSNQHCTTVLNAGRPTEKDLLRLGEKFSIRNRKQIIEQVREAVALWPRLSEEAGVWPATRKIIAETLG